jgi:hypothetical protein
MAVVSATHRRPATAVLDLRQDEEDVSGPVMGALIFGGIGFGLASLTWDLDALLYGEAIGIGLGAHVGNRRRGRALAPLVASVGVMAAARLLSSEFGATREWVLVVPMLQITGAVIAETVTARRGTHR